MHKVAIYGAGGFGKEVCCIISKINQRNHIWEFIGFFDDGVKADSQISHFGRVLGNINDLNKWKENLSVVFAIGNPKSLKYLVENISNRKIDFPNIIHPEVTFSDHYSFKIGIGNVLTRGCSFSCDVKIGDFNQFNSISALAHDVSLGSYNILMPLTRVSGETKIGDANFFGIGSIILQQVKNRQ